MGDGAFSWNKLASVTLGTGLITIGGQAFTANENLETIVIPNSVTVIGDYAFNYCGLTSVTLGSRVQTIGWSAFSQNKLTEITLPASVRTIGGNAFSKNQITSLTIPNGVTVIGGDAFNKNPITTLVIPASLAKYTTVSVATVTGGIARFAFDPSALTRITLPANMDERNLASSFDASFIAFWKNQNKAAGTYVKNGPVWSKQ
jgi:hypothetical protein